MAIISEGFRVGELTPKQRESLLRELREIDARLKHADAMLRLLLRAKGIDPPKARHDG